MKTHQHYMCSARSFISMDLKDATYTSLRRFLIPLKMRTSYYR
ncbi:hypothetical protein RchiOBHm_Chr5g0069931 [Rosa chinensis]|uniref:Uncharacterized protein n=1 Tax=Rosa chinensis TaxID=74649 RepID=A0A2P6QK28_ROSCH|nr:hypothetical protein RchiOBHm_Chr5g0069931 [Rosa chinensis]